MMDGGLVDLCGGGGPLVIPRDGWRAGSSWLVTNQFLRDQVILGELVGPADHHRSW